MTPNTPKQGQMYRCDACRFEAHIDIGGFEQVQSGGTFVCPKCNHFTTLSIAKPKKPSSLSRSRLKPMSRKRKELVAVVGPERKARKADVGCCMVCRQPFPPEQLEGDEIARGTGREKCLSVPELTLISCSKCHVKTQNWPPPKRLALLTAFNLDFACGKYCEIMGYASTHLTRDSVMVYLERSRDVNGTSPIKFKPEKKTKGAI